MHPLDAIVIQPEGTISSSIIWLHGLGADGHDFVPIVEMLGLPETRFILPHAPIRPVTLNNGYEMRAWYDIVGLTLGSPQDVAGILASQQQIEQLIAQEIANGIPAANIVLAGFSQGGAIALHTALRYEKRLAGVLALSTYLPLRDKLESERSAANQALPIFMAHGSADQVITPEIAEISAAQLRQAGYAVEWHSYAMAHSVCDAEIADIQQFLLGILPFRISTP